MAATPAASRSLRPPTVRGGRRKRMSGAEWTVSQLVALDRMSGALAIPEIVDEVNARGPEHTERALVQHASQTSISLARRRRRQAWTDGEDQILRSEAGRLTASEI